MSLLHFRSIFISDVHLGTRGARAEFLLDFLKHTSSTCLYLVGDIVDIWKMQNGWYWPQINNEIIRMIFRKARNGTRVVYVPGNHDELFRDYVGMELGGVHIVKEALHQTIDGRTFLVLHGDEFDGLVKHNRWLKLIGSGIYEVLLPLNRWYNHFRRRLGFSYWSLSGYLKHRVRNAVEYMQGFEDAVALAAARRRVDGLICGHIHKAALGNIGKVVYGNTGDWVESCTALVEDMTGELRLLRWAEESARLLDQAVSSSHRDTLPAAHRLRQTASGN